MTTLYEYQQQIVKEIEDFIKTAEVDSYELTDAFKEHSKNNPDRGGIDFSQKTWRQYIWDSRDAASADKYKGWILEIVNGLAKMKREKAKEEKKTEDQKKQEEADWWKEYYKENADYWKKSSDWWRDYDNKKYDWQNDDKKREAENKKFFEKDNKKDDFDEKKKKEYIGDVEIYLAKENVSGERLSQRLGVSDWREKINQATGWNDALWKSSDLKDIIRKLKLEFTCANCGVKKEEYTAYGVGSKKACSWECEKALEGEEKPTKNPSKVNYGNNFGFSSVSEFFAWMKKLGVKEIKFDFNTNQVVISCGGKELSVSDSNAGLTTKQRQALTERFKSETSPITFSQVKSSLEKGNKEKGGNGGIIAVIVIVGMIFAVIVGVVVHKNRRERDY